MNLFDSTYHILSLFNGMRLTTPDAWQRELIADNVALDIDIEKDLVASPPIMIERLSGGNNILHRRIECYASLLSHAYQMITPGRRERLYRPEFITDIQDAFVIDYNRHALFFFTHRDYLPEGNMLFSAKEIMVALTEIKQHLADQWQKNERGYALSVESGCSFEQEFLRQLYSHYAYHHRGEKDEGVPFIPASLYSDTPPIMVDILPDNHYTVSVDKGLGQFLREELGAQLPPVA